MCAHLLYMWYRCAPPSRSTHCSQCSRSTHLQHQPRKLRTSSHSRATSPHTHKTRGPLHPSALLEALARPAHAAARKLAPRVAVAFGLVHVVLCGLGVDGPEVVLRCVGDLARRVPARWRHSGVGGGRERRKPQVGQGVIMGRRWSHKHGTCMSGAAPKHGQVM